MRVREKYNPYGTRKERGLADYIKHRRETGICETCNQEMKEHDKCEACGILCGPGHDRSTEEYQGRELCWNCVEDWKKKGKGINLFKFRWPTGMPIGRPKVRKVKVATRRVGRPSKVVLSIKEAKSA